jgi:NADH-quinone oxidoreductase subunit L
MVARLSPIFEFAPDALVVVAVVGALTAFVGATIGITQNDIKRVIAYSTMSQLGYMFFALGVSAYGAAIFHLMTHAFFKALLFLGAGSVIHAMSDEQDMRKMGGIYRAIPWTYALMWIGSLSLAGVGIPGVIGFAGFYSKDLVLEAAFADHTWFGSLAFWLGVIAALLTAAYTFRVIFMTFHGKPRADEKVMAHVHESPWIMLAPLLLLAFGAVFAGIIGYSAFVGDAREAFWGQSLFVLPANDTVEAAHHVPFFFKALPVLVGLVGIAIAYYAYMVRTDLPGRLIDRFRAIHAFLSGKWYFDELYDAAIVKPAYRLGRGLWQIGDLGIIDRFGPDGFAATARRVAQRASGFQTGYVYHYAFVMLIGLVAFVTWYLYSLRV